jgi:hypothetical protein
MFTALTAEVRTTLALILENQKAIAIELRGQRQLLETMDRKMNDGMGSVSRAFAQIKTVSEYFDENICETLGKLSLSTMDITL